MSNYMFSYLYNTNKGLCQVCLLVTDVTAARRRLGHEYSGGWLVSSPRNLPGVEYELHAACLARSPLEALHLGCGLAPERMGNYEN